MALRYAVYDTAAGDVTIIVDDKEILGLRFGALDIPMASNEENTVLYDAIVELNQYFFGQRKTFDLRLKPEGTEFELKVYAYLQTIPYGETRSYEEVAEALGDKKAAKAVGMAVNRNPIPLFIPCHRVIGKKGDLVGYQGGLDLKKKLLAMEKANMNRTFKPGNFQDQIGRAHV